MASALWRLECLNPWFSEQFWPELYREVAHSPEPPRILDRMKQAMNEPPASIDAARWIAHGMSRATGNDDTHPSFRDRVKALGLSADEMGIAGFPPPVALAAAEVLMGPDLGAIKEDLDVDWQNASRAGWQDRRRRAANEARRGAPSDASGLASPPATAAAALWESARETADLQGISAALPLLRQVLDRDPSHAGASVLLGFQLAKIGDPAGETLLWQVIESADQGWAGQAYHSLQEHYRMTGQTDRLRDLRIRQDRFEAEAANGQTERSKVVASDTFLHHALTYAQLEPLRRVLAAQADCARRGWCERSCCTSPPVRYSSCASGASHTDGALGRPIENAPLQDD